MPNATIFSVLDASSVFWQVQLDMRVLDSVPLTHCSEDTYMFKCLPFGLPSSQDIFQRVISEMFEDIQGVEVVMDDLLIWGENRDQHNERLTHV